MLPLVSVLRGYELSNVETHHYGILQYYYLSFRVSNYDMQALIIFIVVYIVYLFQHTSSSETLLHDV
jgi:hypothetical protein